MSDTNFFWGGPHPVSRGTLVLPPGMKPMLPEAEGRIFLNYWTAEEAHAMNFNK